VEYSPGTTVVIPVWGDYVGAGLDKAVASVLSQGVPGLQVLVVDNFSSPPVQADWPECTVVRTPSRLSLGQARNFGLGLVSTEFVVFLDADDELLPGVIAALQRELASRPSVVAVAPALVDRATGTQYPWPRDWAFRLSEDHPSMFRALEIIRPMFPVNAALIRTLTAKDSLGYGESHLAAEDWLLGVSLVLRGEVLLVRIPGLVYESRAGGRWSGQTSWRAQRYHRLEVRRRIAHEDALAWPGKALAPLLAVIHEVDVLRKTRTALRVRQWVDSRRSPASG